MSVFIAIVVFTIIVLVHEWGHYIAARKSGVLVEEFAIGMGPTIFSRKRGDTVFSIRLFPIGGFCKMLGEDTDNFEPRAFNSKSVYSRLLVISAGVIMNFLLAFIIFSIIAFVAGISVPVVKQVVDGSPAQAAQLMAGDRITEINGTKINIGSDLMFSLSQSKGQPMKVVLLRGGESYIKIIVPQKDAEGNYKIGFLLDGKSGAISENTTLQKASIFDSIAEGFWSIAFYVKVTLFGLMQLITRNLSVSEMSGPIGIVTVISDVYTMAAKESIISVILNMAKFVAILSANLAVFNFLPLPALDGGRLVFLTVEAIRKKPIAPEKEGMVHFVGFVLLMVLAVFVAYNDILKIL